MYRDRLQGMQGEPSRLGLGLVDFCPSNICQALLELKKARANGLSSRTRRVEHPNKSQPNPGPRCDDSPCTWNHVNLALQHFYAQKLKAKLHDIALARKIGCGIYTVTAYITSPLLAYLYNKGRSERTRNSET